MLTIAEIMTPQPYTLGPDDTLALARELMAEHHIRHIPIVDSGSNLVGVVSQRDILAAGGAAKIAARASTATSKQEQLTLASVMTSPAQSVTEDTSLRGSAMYLHKHKLGCLPVVRDQELVGIITDADFVVIAIHLLEQLEAAEADEL